jgi:hypothetical protein
MAMSQKPTPRTRHMDIKYHALCEWVKQDLLKLEGIDTTINLADHFTKQLGWVLFHHHMDYIFRKVPPMYSSAFAQFFKHTHLTKSVPPNMLPEADPVWLPIAAAAARFLHYMVIYTQPYHLTVLLTLCLGLSILVGHRLLL